MGASDGRDGLDDIVNSDQTMQMFQVCGNNAGSPHPKWTS